MCKMIVKSINVEESNVWIASVIVEFMLIVWPGLNSRIVFDENLTKLNVEDGIFTEEMLSKFR